MAARLGALLENCARHLRYLKAARGRLPKPLTAGHLCEQSDTFRVMRNALAHDYPESAEEKAAALDLAIEMADQMEAVLQRLRDEAGKRRPTP